MAVALGKAGYEIGQEKEDVDGEVVIPDAGKEFQALPSANENIEVDQRVDAENDEEKYQHRKVLHEIKRVELGIDLYAYIFEFSTQRGIGFGDLHHEAFYLRKISFYRQTYARSDMLQEFGFNVHFFFDNVVDGLVIDRVVKVIAGFGCGSIGFYGQIHNKTVANDLLFGKASVVGEKLHILEKDKCHSFTFRNAKVGIMSQNRKVKCMSTK
jgi:hypothetical protein